MLVSRILILANNYGPPYGSAEANFGKVMQSDFKNIVMK